MYKKFNLPALAAAICCGFTACTNCNVPVQKTPAAPAVQEVKKAL